MIEVDVHQQIGPEEENKWFALWGLENMVFSLDTVKEIFNRNQDESDFRFNYHSPGGSVPEMFAIYDYIRESGKNIYSHIEGECDSACVTLFLAAPKDNRSASEHASALIHSIRGGVYGTSDDVNNFLSEMQEEDAHMLDIYADRTGYDRSELENLIKKEKRCFVKDLQKYGFISKVASYNTNLTKMAERKRDIINKLMTASDAIIGKIGALLDKAPVDPVDPPEKRYEFLDKAGAVMFTVERENDQLAVGDKASPDGVFDLGEDRKVTIDKGVITAIDEVDEEPEVDLAEHQRLVDENAQMRTLLAEAQTAIRDLKASVTSNFVPQGRVISPGKAGGSGSAEKSVADMKSEIREKLGTDKK